MIQVQTTDEFDRWLLKLRDRSAAAIVVARILRLGKGLLGDAKSVGCGIHELRIDYGPGYRVYFTYRSGELLLLLCGGDKSSQARDIRTAKAMAARRNPAPRD